ncbi:uncharacterized protein LOC124463019 isoform X2 [Hypomesus transpacificus]|uniref:uncharacterized protein LOC124463019 isoform X2 n=1 Tax=Hypomesus transpacificus TaxID=137520 RepID=UPI001F078921|nr:uncharacterized protein LOC124463019 isoform X2 [Hypomesus transpacificus]
MGEGLRITLVLVSIIFLDQLGWTRGEDIFLNHYTSTYGQLCYDACNLYENDYYWCNTKEGWDYCSLRENTDYKGYECRDDHPCGKHEKDHYWCYTKAGNGSFCGEVKLKSLLYITSMYHSVCRDECLYDELNLHYGCNTDKGWDYCSPIYNVTFKNERCQSDHWCDTHGDNHTWCRTDSGWDYCGLIETRGVNRILERQKNKPSNAVLICTMNDSGNKKVTEISAEPNPSGIRDGSKNLRIDQQGLAKRHNLYYYNLQIQLNGHRIPGTSSTVAMALIPKNKGVPDRYVRRSFTESFRRRANVYVDVRDSNIPSHNVQDCG